MTKTIPTKTRIRSAPTAQKQCMPIVGTIPQRAYTAEIQSRTHTLERCAEHNLFHVWVYNPDEAQNRYNTARSARTEGYRRLRSGHYLPADYGKKREKSSIVNEI